MTDDRAAFPARLRTLREYLGHDVPSFAKLIGSTPRTVRAYEAGPRRIMMAFVMAVGEATDVSLDWLSTGRLRHDLPRDDAVPKFRSRPTA